MKKIVPANRTDENQIESRPAKDEDGSFLEKLYCRMRENEFARAGLSDIQMQSLLKMQFQMQNQAYRMQFPGAVQYIAEFRETPVGRLIVERGETEIRLIDISLLEEFRNRGFGTLLLDKLKTEAAAGAKPLRLRVLKTNEAAQRFYDRSGFTVIEDTDLYFGMEWRDQ